MRVQQLCVIAAVAMGASAASADVTPIGEFTGQQREGFEGILPPGGYSGPLSIFGGEATMRDTLADVCVIALSWWGPGGEVLPYNGNLMGGTVAGPTLFEFQTPVLQFGGFFATVGELPGGTVIFRDQAGAEIATLSLSVQPGMWGWQGWSSDVPISSIEVIGANVPAVSMQYDELQVNFVPAPGAAGLLAAGAMVLARRRR